MLLKKTEISYFFWKIRTVGKLRKSPSMERKFSFVLFRLVDWYYISCTTDGKLLIFEDIDFRFFYCDISTIGTPDFQWFEVEKVN